MPVLPEHIHIEGEDSLLTRAEHVDQYRHLFDGLYAVAIVSFLALVAAIAALQFV